MITELKYVNYVHIHLINKLVVLTYILKYSLIISMVLFFLQMQNEHMKKLLYLSEIDLLLIIINTNRKIQFNTFNKIKYYNKIVNKKIDFYIFFYIICIRYIIK